MPESIPSKLRSGRYVLGTASTTELPAEIAGRDAVLGLPIVAKVARAGTPAASALFHEARVVSRVDAPGLVPILDIGQSAGWGWSIRRGTAFASLERDEPMDAGGLVDALGPVVEALTALQELGAVHRDIRPSNLLLGREGARLTGLGYALFPRLVGVPTPPSSPYSAPELTNPAGASSASDQYSLAATLVRAVTGREPDRLHGQPETSPAWEGVPDWLRPVLKKATQRRPERRYESIAAFALALRVARPAPEADAAEADLPRALVVSADQGVVSRVLQDLSGMEGIVARSHGEMERALARWPIGVAVLDVAALGGVERVPPLDVPMVLVLDRNEALQTLGEGMSGVEAVLMRPLVPGAVLRVVSGVLERAGIEVDPGAARVMIVEDDVVQAALLSRILARERMRPELFGTGKAVLDDEGPEPALYILDIGLPDISGLEVLRQLRLDRTRGGIPVLMLSAHDDTSQIVEALDLGADDYVVKPYAPALLLARVRRLLKGRI